MGEKRLHWNRHDRAHRAEFARYLAPLVAASRTKSFTDAESLAYLITLADVPRDVLGDAIQRVLLDGVTWMPKAGDIKAACCDVADERRSAAARHAKALCEDCETCQGSGWEYIRDESGVERVRPCWCRRRGWELIAQACDPIARPALSAATEALGEHE